MKILISLSAKVEKYRTPLDSILSKAELKFLKSWCIDGSVATSASLELFKTIRKKLEKAGVYVESKGAPIFRGINLTTAQFEKLVIDGGLPETGTTAVSWTRDPNKALAYSKGSMKRTPGPVCVILKKKTGSYASEKVIELMDVAQRVAAHFKAGAPFNREVILRSKPLSIEDVAFVFCNGDFNKQNKLKFQKSLLKLQSLGLTGKNITIEKSFLKVNSSGILINAKRPTQLRFAGF